VRSRSGAGGEDSASNASTDCRTQSALAGRAAFPPEQIAEVKALACEPPSDGAPLSRRSTADVHRLVIKRGISEASQSTIVRWLAEDAIRPWQHRSWIFPTDPDFAEKAARILDLYQGRFEGKLLHPGDFVISADEKPSIQARRRIEETLAPAPGVARGQRVEHTRARRGAHLSRRLGRAPWQDIRALGAKRRDRALRPARLAGDDQGALRFGAAGVLDRR
jgi:hypothetical protein